MYYFRCSLLVFFSAIICLMVWVKPLLSTQKKLEQTQEQSDSSCPEPDCDETADEETNEEDPEWSDEFNLVASSVFKVRFLITLPDFFTYSAHRSEYFASITIPPPER